MYATSLEIYLFCLQFFIYFLGQTGKPKIIIIILCSIDSGNVNAQPTPLYESRHRSLWPLRITITLTESAFFCNPGLKNCWHGRPGMEPTTTTTTLDLSSQSGAYDLSTMMSKVERLEPKTFNVTLNKLENCDWQKHSNAIKRIVHKMSIKRIMLLGLEYTRAEKWA